MVWPCRKVFWFKKNSSARQTEWKKKTKEVDRRRGERTISAKAAEDRTIWKRVVMKVICDTPKTLQGHEID